MAFEKEFFVPIDMHGLQIINHRLHMHSSDPSSPNEGDIWFNSITHEPTSRVTRGITSSNRSLISDDNDFHNRLNTVITAGDADELVIWDDSVSPIDHEQQYRKISRVNFLSGISIIQNTYKRVIANTGTLNLDANGADDLAISGDGTIIETFGMATGQKTLSLVWKNQIANRILAGPSSGGAAIPTFRTLLDVDMPTSYSSNDWDIAHSHSLVTSGNPHNVTYAEIGGLWERNGIVISPINNGDTLAIDSIDEETLNAGVIIEQVLLKDGGIALLTGATVDTIETTLTNNDTRIPTSGAVFDQITGGTHYKGEYNASTNVPDLDVSPSGIFIGDMYTVTVDGTFFTEAVQAGDFLIAEITDPTLLTDWTVVNKNIPPYTFLNLGDSPASYVGTAEYMVMVNSIPNALEFIAPSGYGLSNFNDDLGHVENVSTALSIGTITATTFGITSDGSANDVILPEANTTNAGLLGADKWDEIVANSLKETNVTTNLGYTAATGIVTSSDGTDTTIGLFPTDSENYGLVKGSNSVDATYYLNATGNWTVPTGNDIINIGTTTQVPYVNVAGDDFLYSANLVFDGTNLGITGTCAATTVTGINVTTGADPGHTHTAYEPVLGNPGVDGYILSFTALGVRSWVSNAAMTYPGAGIALSTGTDWGASIVNNSANWNTAYGWGNWASNFGTTAGKITQGNDSRLSNSRTPTQHAMNSATYHSSTDITILNATTSKHGFLPKLGGGTTNFLRADGTWAPPAAGGGGMTVSVITEATNAVKDYIYVLTGEAAITLTLPAAPSVGDALKVVDLTGLTTCVLARNGLNIMGVAEDLTLDKLNAGFELVYSDAAIGWTIL